MQNLVCHIAKIFLFNSCPTFQRNIHENHLNVLKYNRFQYFYGKQLNSKELSIHILNPFTST